MSVEFDSKMHRDANFLAVIYETCMMDPHLATIAKAYLDLRNRRGLPTPLKCHPSIQLISGGYFDFTNPGAAHIFPEDIAHALSKIARCNGHTLGDHGYSVAQHCVLASRYAPEGFKFEALMHDAPEYVTGDMTTPFKQLLADFVGYEQRIEHAIARRFYLPPSMSPEVKVVDLRMAATEKRDLMPADAEGDGWEMLRGVEPYEEIIEAWPAPVARVGFMVAFDKLWHEHHKLMTENES